MKTQIRSLLMLVTLLASFHQVTAQGTAFTYQGRLNDGGNPANGTYDLTFALFNAGSGGGQTGSTVTDNGAGVTNGLFTVTLDFGANFPGADRWLEIGVRTNGGGSFTTLSPRQKLTPTPYAITAENLNGTLASGGLSGTYGGAITLNNAANQFTGTFSGNGSGLTSVNAATLDGLSAANFWQLTGNAGTTAGVNFVGTTDNRPLEFRANNVRVMQLAYASNSASGFSPNIIGGFPGNFVSDGVVGATIVGGGSTNGLFIPSTNQVLADFGTVVGGYGNSAGGPYSVAMGFRSTASGNKSTAMGAATAAGDYSSAMGNSGASGNFSTAMGSSGAGARGATAMGESTANGQYSTAMGLATVTGEGASAMGEFSTVSADFASIGGGTGNTIETNANDATIGGGNGNTIESYANDATIGGGNRNLIEIGDSWSTIAGGWGNTIQSNAYYATIGGGVLNTIGTNAYIATIAGGDGNTIQTNADMSTIGGGFSNMIQTNAAQSTIAGGVFNTIQTYSPNATIGGGYGNNIQDGSPDSTIAGGSGNTIEVLSDWAAISGGGDNDIQSLTTKSTIGGGAFNTIQTNTGSCTIGGGEQNEILPYSGGATIPGGYGNRAAGEGSFAAGELAYATNTACFVWNAFPGIARSFADARFHVFGANGFSVDYFSQRPDGGGTHWAGIGIISGQTISTYNGAFLSDSGVWQNASDRNRKTDFASVNPRTVLDKLAALPVQSWRYTNETDVVRHLGPTAQDFKAAFGLGTDDKSIGTLDESGVALAAIQGLKLKLDEKDAEVQKLTRQNNSLEKRLSALEHMVQAFAEKK